MPRTNTHANQTILGESVGYAFPDTDRPTVKQSAVQTNCINCAAPLNLQKDNCKYCKTPIIERRDSFEIFGVERHIFAPLEG